MSGVRCAVVGLGVIGAHHAAALTGIRDAELVACIDLDPKAEARCPAGCRFSTKLDILGDLGVQATVVATPEGTHRSPVEAALAAGSTVLCEKPLAASLADADAMIMAASRSKSRLLVAHTLRFDPRYRSVQEAIAAGRLGRLQTVSCRRSMWGQEGSIYAGRTDLALCLGVHDVDVMRWCAGEIIRVHAEAGPSGLHPTTADSLMAVLRFSSGAVGALDLCWNLPGEGGVAWDTQLVCVGTQRSAYLEVRGGTEVGQAADLIPEASYMYELNGVVGGVVTLMDRIFVQHVAGQGSWPGADLADARRAVEVALAIGESAASGRSVDLPAIG